MERSRKNAISSENETHSQIPQHDVIFTQSPERNKKKHTERKWIRTIHKVSFGKALTYLRLDEGLPIQQFATEAEIGKRQLYGFEENSETPHHYILNKIIVASSLEPQGKPAQLLRLKRIKKSPMSLLELQTCTYGALSTYIRQVLGFSQADLAKITGSNQQYINDIENNKSKVGPRAQKKFVALLDNTAQAPFEEIFRQKVQSPNTKIPYSLAQSASAKSYLFAPDIENLPEAPMPSLDQRFFDDLIEYYNSQQEITIGNMLTYIRSKRGETQKQFADVTQKKQSHIAKMELSQTPPQDFTIAKITKSLGYDIHHPITHLLIDIAKENKRNNL